MILPNRRSGLDLPALTVEQSLRLACSWLTDVAQIRTTALTIEKNSAGHSYTTWRGAIRGEYCGATQEWDFFAPVWHTGQAIKALVLASAALGDERLLEAAELSAGFIGAARINDARDPDHGLIFAFENGPTNINTSAILECADGLLRLSDATGKNEYAEWAIAAVRWVGSRMYRGDGLFDDCFELSRRKVVPGPWLSGRDGERATRPLIDDALFLEVYRRTGDAGARKIFFATADRLLAEEEPAGNWIRFVPCDMATGSLHPRQAYWWGCPMIAAYEESGDDRYLACGIRAGEWYLKAMRVDGALFRDTRLDFRTPAFGHENSGISCAIILWTALWRITGEVRWKSAIDTALRFCLRVQFQETFDPNLLGAILERVRMPDGTDDSPFDLRDLGTIFYVQAAAGLLGSKLLAK